MSLDGSNGFGAALLEGQRVDHFLDAMAAGAAVVATADGYVDRTKRRALLADASSYPELPRLRVLERFDDYVDLLDKDPTSGGHEVFESVSVFADDPARARKLLDVFTDIAATTGSTGARDAVEDLRIVLKLPR